MLRRRVGTGGFSLQNIPQFRKVLLTQNDGVMRGNVQESLCRFGMREEDGGKQDVCINQYPHIFFRIELRLPRLVYLAHS